MTAKFAILSFVTLLVAIAPHVGAAYARRAPSHDHPYIVVKLSDLRSAYLQRAGVVRYDDPNASADGVREQLQRHFDVVLCLLSLTTEQSIDVAMLRLEAAEDQRWNDSERAAWREKLMAMRLVQLQRLGAYRDRGIFPLNEGQSADPSPIFVDRLGTRCAVGHLMHCSGWSDDVDSIASSNNLVYVPDAPHSAIAEWVLTSGLTIEEAALIQPGYPFTGGQYDASVYESGESVIEKDGLRFSNFQMQSQNFPDIGTKPTLLGLGLLAGKGSYTDSTFNFLTYTPMGTHWIAIGASNGQLALHSLGASAPATRAQLTYISFDVAAISADQRIAGISESSNSIWGGFNNINLAGTLPAAATFGLETSASDGTNPLGDLIINELNWSYGFRQYASRSFAPKQQLHVETSIYLEEGVALSTYMVDFNVVNAPEPTTGFAIVTLAVFVLARDNGRRQTPTAVIALPYSPPSA